MDFQGEKMLALATLEEGFREEKEFFDAPLEPFLAKINALDQVYTKSSCMGHEDPQPYSCECCDEVAYQHPYPFLALEIVPAELGRVRAAFENAPFHVSGDLKSESEVCFIGIDATEQILSYSSMFEHIQQVLEELFLE